MIRPSICAVLLAVVCWGIVARLPAEETPGNWPQWRGPNRDNRSADTGLLKSWPDGGPPLEWTVEGLGEGIASVSVAEGRIYTVGHIDEKEYVTAMEERTGMRMWATAIGPTIGKVENNRMMRWLSQRTPTVDGEQLYVVRADAQLICLARDDGRELWRRDFAADFGTKERPFGFCDRPLVDGDKLICVPSGSVGSIVALDKVTGEVLWTTLIGTGEHGSYGSMVVADVGGIRQYVTFLERSLVGVAADDGRLLWKYDGIATYSVHTFTPIMLGDEVLAASGRGGGLYRLSVERDQKCFDAKLAYHQPSLPFDGFHDSMVLAGDHLYCCTGQGILTCVNAASGEIAWRTRDTGRGLAALTWADDRLYVRHSNETVTLVETDPVQCVIQGTFSIPDPVNSPGATLPVVTGGRLYLRDDNRLHCYDVREDAPPRGEPARIVLAKPTDSSEALDGPGRVPKSIFVPTPEDVVVRMLELAEVKQDDLVVDLGSGDGRIVIAAAKKYLCRAVGYEIDEELIEIARARIVEQEVAELVTIEQQDMYTADLSEVDVVAVYVYPSALEKMKVQFAKLKPGARIISHFFEIPGLKPDKVFEVESQETGSKHRILLYTVPLMESE